MILLQAFIRLLTEKKLNSISISTILAIILLCNLLLLLGAELQLSNNNANSNNVNANTKTNTNSSSSTSASTSASVSAMTSWVDLIAVNAACPRFLVVNVVDEGMGDMITRLLMGVAVAVNLKATLVFYHEFWRYSNHLESGYGNIFETELGIPFLEVKLYKFIEHTYKPFIIPGHVHADFGIYSQRNYFDKYPCNSLVHLAATCYGPGDWCSWYISSNLQSLTKAVVDDSIRRIPSYPLVEPLDQRVLNIVWHMRTGDVCLHCTNASKFEKVHKFIESILGPALANRTRTIVVHMADKRIPELFKNIPNAIMYTNREERNAIRLFRQTDILVTTGSSFPNSVSVFTPLHRPIIFQTLDKDAETADHGGRGQNPSFLREKYFLAEGRSVRLDADWDVVGFRAEDVKYILQCNGVLDRIQAALSAAATTVTAAAAADG